jgi:hypothetical protein
MSVRGRGVKSLQRTAPRSLTTRPASLSIVPWACPPPRDGAIVKAVKRSVAESLVVGSLVALAIIFVAQKQLLSVLEVISPVFYLPGQGASLLSGNSQEPPPWLFHTLLGLQCILAVFAIGWLAGRYRGRSAKT